MLREFRPGFRSWSCQWEEFGHSARLPGLREQKKQVSKQASKHNVSKGPKAAQKKPHPSVKKSMIG
jgi:hypothetical protein